MTTLNVRVDAPRERVFGLLTDYEGYVEWTPDVIDVTLLAKEGDIAVVEFSSPELMSGRYQLEFVHSRPDAIVYRQKGLFERTGRQDWGVRGSWKLSDAPDGTGCIVTGTMTMSQSRWRRVAHGDRAQIILARRLDVIGGLFTADVRRAGQELPEAERRFLDALVGADNSTTTIWFDGVAHALRKVDR
jgi:hypothetical protein